MAVRLQKLIAEAGVCSRRKAEQLIKSGKVLLNGRIATIGESADPEKDEIFVDGETLKPEKKIYLMFNKPKGFITTASDPFGRNSVLQLIHVPQRVFPVGRLDQDTRGLLLLTNDGTWANRIMHPRYRVKKTYEAILDRQIHPGDIDKINKGIYIDRKKIEARARKLSSKKVEITIHTGLNKEVKRIFKKLEYWVRDLKRTRIGPLRIDVKEGRYRHLVKSEVDKFSR